MGGLARRGGVDAPPRRRRPYGPRGARADGAKYPNENWPNTRTDVLT